MKKRNYTHVQALLPEIRAMLAEGRTQREVAEYYGCLLYTSRTLQSISTSAVLLERQGKCQSRARGRT